MIEISGLEFRYPNSDFCLKLPQLTLAKGESMALVGASGIGKTTLLQLIAGIVTPNAGRIRVGNAVVSELSDQQCRAYRLRNMGLVFQEFELIDYLSVFDNILLPFHLSGELHLDSAVRERVGDLARAVGIADKLRDYPCRLSQGERQRVALCRALMPSPSLILADEPTGNLDPFNKRCVMEILFDYVAEHHATLITVTHDHQLLNRFDSVIDVEKFHRQHLLPVEAA